MAKPYMRWILLGLLLTYVLAPNNVQAEEGDQTRVNAQQQNYSPSMVQIRDTMRKLWTDHVTWTRNYIVSAVANSPDRDKVLVRLLINQQDIGNAIKPFYGEVAGNKLADLLKQHILLAGKVLEAAKSGNQADLTKFNKEWYRNADNMAQFLSRANPNWSEKTLQAMLNKHLQLVTDTAVARIKGDTDADILAYDRGVEHMLMFADMLSSGIIKQFPNRFQ